MHLSGQPSAQPEIIPELVPVIREIVFVLRRQLEESDDLRYHQDIMAIISSPEIEQRLVFSLSRDPRTYGPAIDLSIQTGKTFFPIPFGSEAVDEVLCRVGELERQALVHLAGQTSIAAFQRLLEASTPGHLGLPHGKFANKKAFYEEMAADTRRLLSEFLS